MCGTVLSMHVQLGKGRASALAPSCPLCIFPPTGLCPAPLDTIVCLRCQELGFSRGPEVLPGHLCLPLRPCCLPLPLTPSLTSFWNSQKSRLPSPISSWGTEEGRLHIRPESPLTLGYVQTRFPSWNIRSLDSTLSPFILHYR